MGEKGKAGVKSADFLPLKIVFMAVLCFFLASVH